MTERAPSGARLEVEDLSKDYVTGGRTSRIVHGISFAIEPGHFYSLLGPSGCGKTTTLRCVAGLEHADGGAISLAGRRLSGDGAHLSPDHRDIGMVFQNYAIWPHMTVYENVAFPLRVERPRLSKKAIDERVEEALALVRLGDLTHRHAVAMSGGQQQRLALARALVRRPSLLLLDEPLANLDAKLRDDMRLELRELQSRLGITTLYVTHDQAEALSMSDRVAVMRHGRIVQEGTPREIYQTPATPFVADFVGRANLVMADVTSRISDSEVLISALGSHLRASCHGRSVGDKVRLSIRPENIRAHDTRPERPNVVTGVVEKVEFLGQILACQVRVGPHLVNVLQNPLTQPRVGDLVYLELAPEVCTVLAEDQVAS
jgi:iron(III) transport system ATP-binding protein